jgi:tetratricopeptide (TPR) repeat protein
VLKRAVLFFALAAGLLAMTAARSQQVLGCGSLENAFGPFDYRDPEARGQPLHLVEKAHFTADVEWLRHGKSSAHVIDDLNYTLRAFPNHHRALNSVAEYALQGGQFPRDSQIPSAECYFQRAIAFRPDDETVRMIYGNYLFRLGNSDGARTQYEEALRLAPTSVEVNYNAGLFFVAQNDLARAKQCAQIAYDGGYPLPGLKNKIKAAETAKTP